MFKRLKSGQVGNNGIPLSFDASSQSTSFASTKNGNDLNDVSLLLVFYLWLTHNIRIINIKIFLSIF